MITEIKNQKQVKKKKPTQKRPHGIQKTLWVKLNRNNFDSLLQDVYNNQNNDEFKTVVEKKPYDLKNAKKFLLKIITQKVTEKDALKLNSDLITPDIIALESEIVRPKIREITF